MDLVVGWLVCLLFQLFLSLTGCLVSSGFETTILNSFRIMLLLVTCIAHLITHIPWQYSLNPAGTVCYLRGPRFFSTVTDFMVYSLFHRASPCLQAASPVQSLPFIRAFAKLRKVTLSFAMSVRLSFRPYGTTQLPLDGFSLNLAFEHFSKVCRENPSVIKIWQ